MIHKYIIAAIDCLCVDLNAMVHSNQSNNFNFKTNKGNIKRFAQKDIGIFIQIRKVNARTNNHCPFNTYLVKFCCSLLLLHWSSSCVGCPFLLSALLSAASFRMSFLLVGVNGFVYLTHLYLHDYIYICINVSKRTHMTAKKSQFDTYTHNDNDAACTRTPN